MTQTAQQRLSQSGSLTEGDYRAAVAAVLNKLVAMHGRERVALTAGCTVRTIDNARLEQTSLHASALFNLLALDLTVIDGLAAHFGGHVVPVDADDAPGLDLLANTANLVALHGAALSDGRIDHREAAVLADAAKPVVQGWAAFGARKAVR